MPFDLRLTLAAHVYYGWIIVFACMLASIAVFGTTYAFGVFFDAFIREFAVSRTIPAVVFGLQTPVIYCTGVAAGQYIDQHGRRQTAAVSGGLLTVGLVWTALARSYLAFLVGFGIGYGGCGGLLGALVADLFGNARLNTLFTLVSLSLGVAGIVAPPVAAVIFERVGGYVLAFVGFGSGGVIGAGCIALAARRD